MILGMQSNERVWTTEKIIRFLGKHFLQAHRLSLHDNTIPKLQPKLNQNPNQVFSGFSIDTRKIKNGEIFIALQTQNDDGHRYLRQAAAQGAGGAFVCANNPHVRQILENPDVICQQPAGATHRHRIAQDGFQLFLLKDPIVGLQHLAARYRSELSRTTVLAVTGSNGKTSTCQYLQRILKLLVGNDQVSTSTASFNNYLGVPLSILRASATKHRFLILELGMNAPQEIQALTRIAKPDHALITCVSLAHGGFFPNILAIAKAKLEIAEGLSPQGSLSYHASSPGLVQAQDVCNERDLVLDTHEGLAHPSLPSPHSSARHSIQSPAMGAHTTFTFQGYKSQGIAFSCSRICQSPDGQKNPKSKNHRVKKNSSAPALIAKNLFNKIQLTNIAGIFNLLCRVGYSETEVLHALTQTDFSAVSGRFQMHHLPSSKILIDDSYNANPASFLAALESCRAMFATQKLALFAGEMKELGTFAKTAHQKIVEHVIRLEYDFFAVSGQEFAPMMKKKFQQMLPRTKASAMKSICADNPKLLFAAIQSTEETAAILQECDVILVKGSRTAGMDVIVQEILAGV